MPLFRSCSVSIPEPSVLLTFLLGCFLVSSHYDTAINSHIWVFQTSWLSMQSTLENVPWTLELTRGLCEYLSIHVFHHTAVFPATISSNNFSALLWLQGLGTETVTMLVWVMVIHTMLGSVCFLQSLCMLPGLVVSLVFTSIYRFVLLSTQPGIRHFQIFFKILVV